MGSVGNEAKLAQRMARFLKAELKRAEVTYEELARRLTEHGLNETRDSIASKLKRGTFRATFFIACLAALELEGVRLEDI
jgi:uncharacterized protein DUF6471